MNTCDLTNFLLSAWYGPSLSLSYLSLSLSLLVRSSQISATLMMQQYTAQQQQHDIAKSQLSHVTTRSKPCSLPPPHCSIIAQGAHAKC